MRAYYGRKIKSGILTIDDVPPLWRVLTEKWLKSKERWGKEKMKREYLIAIQGALAAAGAFLSDRLGILYPVLCLLMIMMVLDYFTGMLASKREAIDHPGDNGFGWSSAKGAKGIIKKVGYLCVIAAAMVLDYVIMKVAGELGFTMPASAFFGLLVAVWYLLNELLSIIENAGRMGAAVPEWLLKYIAVLKDKIDSTDYGSGQ